METHGLNAGLPVIASALGGVSRVGRLGLHERRPLRERLGGEAVQLRIDRDQGCLDPNQSSLKPFSLVIQPVVREETASGQDQEASDKSAAQNAEVDSEVVADLPDVFTHAGKRAVNVLDRCFDLSHP